MSDERFPSEPDDDFAWDWKDALTVTFILARRATCSPPSSGRCIGNSSTKGMIVLFILVIVLALVLLGVNLRQGVTPATNPLLGIICASFDQRRYLATRH